MIWPFKKTFAPLRKNTIPNPLEAARLFKQTLALQDGNGRAQIIIAYRVIPVHMAVFERALRQEGDMQPVKIGHLLAELSDQATKAHDEINSRRIGWLNIAGMLFYLCHPEGEIDLPVQDELADIFAMLAEGAYVIPNIIEHNIIWRDYEKMLFPEKVYGKEYVLTLMAPSTIQRNARLRAYAKKNEILL